MKTISIQAILFSLLFLSCGTDPKYTVKKPFLYEVKKGDQIGYLFGTIHTGVVVEDLPDGFWPYFNEAEAFACESNPEKASAALAKEFALKWFRQPGEKKLSERLSPVNYLKFVDQFNKAMPKSRLDPDEFTLFGAYSLLFELEHPLPVVVTRGELVRFKSKFMLDFKLLEKAQNQNKIITTLDNLNFQPIVDCLTKDDSYYLERVEQILNGNTLVDSKIPELLKIAEAYRQGDALGLRDLDPKLEKCLIHDRNEQWTPKIVTMLENFRKPFVAVGVAHIISTEGSLIKTLEAKGYQVTRKELLKPQ